MAPDHKETTAMNTTTDITISMDHRIIFDNHYTMIGKREIGFQINWNELGEPRYWDTAYDATVTIDADGEYTLNLVLGSAHLNADEIRTLGNFLSIVNGWAERETRDRRLEVNLMKSKVEFDAYVAAQAEEV